jgi:hypothetical protein
LVHGLHVLVVSRVDVGNCGANLESGQTGRHRSE